jgi:S1-C subfamily serine protease
MGKFIFKIFFILIIGALGGVIFQAFILPYLASKEYFKQFGFVRILTEREVNLYPKETIIIQESLALEKAIEKVDKVVVGIRAQSKLGEAVEGSGLILTNDGNIIALGDILPKGYDFSFFWEGEELTFKILRVGLKENLVLVKLEKTGLPPAAFADFEKIRLGQRVFLVGIIFEKGIPRKIANQGIIKDFDEDLIETNIFEKSNLQGSPLFNIEGQVIGLTTIGKTGQVFAIPINKIKEFTGF